MNRILVSGTICKKIVVKQEGKKVFYSFYLRCKRSNGKEDVIPCLGLKKVVGRISPGCQISVLGKIQTKNCEKPENKHGVEVFVSVRETMPYLGMDINEVFLEQAYLCKNPVSRTDSNGKKICDLCLAVNEEFGLANYIPSVCWENEACLAAEKRVGDVLSLTGKLRSRIFTKILENGKRVERTAYEVAVNKII